MAQDKKREITMNFSHDEHQAQVAARKHRDRENRKLKAIADLEANANQLGYSIVQICPTCGHIIEKVK